MSLAIRATRDDFVDETGFEIIDAAGGGGGSGGGFSYDPPAETVTMFAPPPPVYEPMSPIETVTMFAPPPPIYMPPPSPATRPPMAPIPESAGAMPGVGMFAPAPIIYMPPATLPGVVSSRPVPAPPPIQMPSSINEQTMSAFALGPALSGAAAVGSAIGGAWDAVSGIFKRKRQQQVPGMPISSAGVGGGIAAAAGAIGRTLGARGRLGGVVGGAVTGAAGGWVWDQLAGMWVKPRKNRRMNVLNPKALKRANRRVVGFSGAARPILKELGYTFSTTRKEKGGAKKRKRC